MNNTLESLRKEIAGLVSKYAKEQYKPQPFIGGETIVPPSGKLLGEEESQDTLIFKGLHYSAWSNLKLQQWMMKAGITKTITFHCARHTYATLQLTLGTDIYTVSKLLGHKELRTTQIYAKVIDDKKREAANKINLDL